MISFKLDPQSGHADSYLDVSFSVKFDPADRVEVRLFNDTIDCPLDLLGVSYGHIINEHTAIIKSVSAVEGYINLFNKDKMNKGLKNFIGVDIRCEVTRYDKDIEISKDEETVTFYNHSQSLDSNIVPFDLIIANSTIDLKNNIPLQLHLVCDKIDKYELCVRSEDGYNECTIEVVSKIGTTSINVPSEILWHDLKLKSSIKSKKFDIFWVKFEGISHLKFMNRKYVRIDNTRLSFNSKDMNPIKTSRLGPTGKNLADYFVLSHRYFVHTHKNWSEYGGYIEGYTNRKLRNLTSFWHESQNMETVTEAVMEIFGNDLKQKKVTSEREIKTAMWHQHRSNVQKTVRSYKGSVKETLTPYAPIYIKKIVETMSTDMDFISGPAPTTSSKRTIKSKRSGGCGCSRKMNG